MEKTLEQLQIMHVYIALEIGSRCNLIYVTRCMALAAFHRLKCNKHTLPTTIQPPISIIQEFAQLGS